MTLDEKLDIFYDSAMKEATTKNIQLVEEYKASLQQIYEEHKESSLQKAQLTLQIETDKLISEKNKKLTEETLKIKRNTSLKISEIKDILFSQVSDKLKDFMLTDEYTSVLKKQIIQAKEFAKNDAITIYINPSDAAKKSYLEKETNTELTVSAIDFFGGTRAVIHAKNILIDNSFMTKLAEEKEMFKL